MVKLETIVPGSRLAGIHGEGAVEVIATRAYGPDAVEVTWKGPDGLGDRILYRDDESGLREVAPARRFAFSGSPPKRFGFAWPISSIPMWPSTPRRSNPYRIS